MTLIRCCLIALCIMFAAGSYAQERATPPPDGPQPSLDKRKARLALLSQISSKSPSGSSFMAKLEDPVEVEGQPVLPKGTLVEGHLETIPARRMMRRGALRMIFDRIKLPDGTVQPARLELSSTESDSATTDSEGTVHPTVSKKRLALQLAAQRWWRSLPMISQKKHWRPMRGAHAGMDWRRAPLSFCCKRDAK